MTMIRTAPTSISQYTHACKYISNSKFFY